MYRNIFIRANSAQYFFYLLNNTTKLGCLPFVNYSKLRWCTPVSLMNIRLKRSQLHMLRLQSDNFEKCMQ